MQFTVFKKYAASMLLSATALFAGCQMPSGAQFQKEVAIVNGEWSYQTQPFFSIDIQDTTAHYQTYILIRHDAAYPFANIWLRLWLKQPGDSAWTGGERLNLRLADISGAWLGTGMGSVWEHKIPLNRTDNLQFPKPGTYQIKMEQIMRNNPLKGVLNAGLIVEKTN